MNEPIISVSGLRGIIGESLTPEVAVRYAAAFAASRPKGKIVLSRDGRASGPTIAAAVQGALSAMGRDVLDAGIAATPTVGVLVREFSAAGGMQISASHNPLEYNGIKLFGADGRVLSAAPGEKVRDAYRAGEFPWAKYDALGEISPIADTLTRHLALVLATVDVEAIRLRKFVALLDANHGAGSLLGRKLLEALGCRVIVLGGEPTGAFAHPPEPTAQNLAGVCRRIVAEKADVGFCQDPDADRLAIIDERGRYIGEEYTLALCLDRVLRKTPGAIVTNCATSRMAADLAAKHHGEFHRSKVGEANVADKMLEVGAVFGGEGNGGPIDPRVGYVRDSFVGMALVLDSMAAEDKTIGELADGLPRYEIEKRAVTMPLEKAPAAIAALASKFRDAQPDDADGLRLDWPDRWLLVRGSNTEPIVRIIAEAPTREGAVRLCEDAQAALKT